MIHAYTFFIELFKQWRKYAVIRAYGLKGTVINVSYYTAWQR